MLACCLIPLAVLGAVLLLRVDLGSVGVFAIMLLCPLLHVFLMRGMGHDHGTTDQACHQEPSGQGVAPEAVAQKGAQRSGAADNALERGRPLHPPA